VNNNTKVCIICPEHGEFWQRAADHIKGCGCCYCSGRAKLDTAQFISKARLINGDRYDYSKVQYINSQTPVIIGCRCHGDFLQTPNSHLSGYGCKECSREQSKSLVMGVGVNDWPAPIKVKGEHILAYKYWHQLLKRLYNTRSLALEPKYKEVGLCEEWKSFSKFKEWFDANYMGGRDDIDLDKDLMCHVLGFKTKFYSPQTCEFLPREINAVIAYDKYTKDLPVGVQHARHSARYTATISINNHKHHLGTFDTVEEAFAVYRAARENNIHQMADKYKSFISERAYAALKHYTINMYE
jgi:hypothetical protein